MKIIFAGTPEFALPSLKALLSAKQHRIIAVYTQPDRPKGRGRLKLFSPIKQLALKENIPVCQPSTLSDDKNQEELTKWQADLMVVVAYGLILPLPVLIIPSLGCINVHASLLPRWRGAAPIQRAILAGDVKTGISIMQMDEGLDTGNILHWATCEIKSRDTSLTLQDRLAMLGAQTLLRSLDAIDRGTYQLHKQNDSESTYAKKIDKIEAEINWDDSALVIDRNIRAFNPKPVSFTFLGDLIIRVWLALVLDETYRDTPGKIVNVSSQGIDVKTGSGVLRLLQLQLPGGRCLAVKELLNSKSHLFPIGAILGRNV